MSYEERINDYLGYFAYKHLPKHLQDVSKPFNDLAREIIKSDGNPTENVMALRKLLEAKDCAVRAML